MKRVKRREERVTWMCYILWRKWERKDLFCFLYDDTVESPLKKKYQRTNTNPWITQPAYTPMFGRCVVVTTKYKGKLCFFRGHLLEMLVYTTEIRTFCFLAQKCPGQNWLFMNGPFNQQKVFLPFSPSKFLKLSCQRGMLVQFLFLPHGAAFGNASLPTLKKLRVIKCECCLIRFYLLEQMLNWI